MGLTETISENFGPLLSFRKLQNNPNYGILSRNFHIYLTGGGGEGSTQAVSLTAFFDAFPNLIQKLYEMQAGTYGQWGALLAGGEVIYPTGYGTLVTAVINELYNVDNSDKN